MDEINQEEYIKLFKSIKKGIELLEANDPENVNINPAIKYENIFLKYVTIAA